MSDLIKKVYVLYEEREESQLCQVKGVWEDRQRAIDAMKEFVSMNELFTEESIVDSHNGIAKSDPTYSEGKYSDYAITEIELA